MPDERVALVVDDVEQMTATVADFLERRVPGLRVVRMTKPLEALEWLKSAPRCDLVLSDNHMNEMLGMDFLAKCRTISPGATRALMTAYLDLKPDEMAAAALHAVVRKPFEWTEFARFAHEIMGLSADDRARLEATAPLAYPRDALAEFNPPKTTTGRGPGAEGQGMGAVRSTAFARPETRPSPAFSRALPAPAATTPAAPSPPSARAAALGPRPSAPGPVVCPHCAAPLDGAPLSDDEEARRIVGILQARPGVATRIVALQAARARPAGTPPNPPRNK